MKAYQMIAMNLIFIQKRRETKNKMAKAKEETKGMNPKEFKKALDNIVKEKDIDPEVVYGAMELALTSAYKKNFNSKTNVKVLFDRETGEIKVYSFLTVVPDDKMTKEEYEDALFEKYALDEDLDTKVEEVEKTEDNEDAEEEQEEEKEQISFFNKETEKIQNLSF